MLATSTATSARRLLLLSRQHRRFDRYRVADRPPRNLVRRLEEGAARTFRLEIPAMGDYTTLPDNLPVPEDDGAADGLPGKAMPELSPPASDGTLSILPHSGLDVRSSIYIPSPAPGRRSATGGTRFRGPAAARPRRADFRDHYADLQHAGASRVFGMSSQDPQYQAELVKRLRLPFVCYPIHSSPWPTRSTADLCRTGLRAPVHAATLVVRDGRIEHVFYPIFPPNTHAQQVLDWLRDHPVQ